MPGMYAAVRSSTADEVAIELVSAVALGNYSPVVHLVFLEVQLDSLRIVFSVHQLTNHFVALRKQQPPPPQSPV